MRILQTIASRDWGGIAGRTVEQIAWLNRHGHDCLLACPEDGEVAVRAEKAGIPVVGFDFDRPFRPDTIRDLRRLTRLAGTEIVESHTGRCANAALFVGDRCALVRTRHTTQALKPTLTRYLRGRFGWDWTVATADVVAGQLAQDRLVPARRLSVIGEWVDHRFFRKDCRAEWRRAWRHRLDCREETFLIGSVGMLRPEKGFDLLIRAFGLMKDCSSQDIALVIAGEPAGDDATRRMLRDLAEGLGLSSKVRFIGYQDDIPGLMQAFDVVAVPSILEAQCRVVAEALASQRPLIASQTGGIGELVSNRINGWLVSPGDPWALASCLLHVKNHPAQVAEICRNAGREAERLLSIDGKMAEYLALYERILSVRQAA